MASAGAGGTPAGAGPQGLAAHDAVPVAPLTARRCSKKTAYRTACPASTGWGGKLPFGDGLAAVAVR